MEMQYLETEEKWFANWDMGGAYWEKQNPIAQRTFVLYQRFILQEPSATYPATQRKCVATRHHSAVSVRQLPSPLRGKMGYSDSLYSWRKRFPYFG